MLTEYFFSDNPDERLIPSCSLSEYQLTEVALMPAGRNNASRYVVCLFVLCRLYLKFMVLFRSVSTSDIMRLQREAELLAREAMAAKSNLRSHGGARAKSVS